MDLVDWSEERFREIEAELRALAEQVGDRRPARLPGLGAERGLRRREPSDAAPWYDGPTLLGYLETVELAGDRNLADRRFPVQWVIRPMADRPPRLPRLRGPGGERDVARRRRGRRPALGPALARGARRDRRRPARRGGAADVRRDPARGRPRRLPRRHARRPGRCPRSRPRARRADLLDERAPARAPGQARGEAHEPVGARGRGRAPLAGRHGDARSRSPRPSGSSSTTSGR